MPAAGFFLKVGIFSGCDSKNQEILCAQSTEEKRQSGRRGWIALEVYVRRKKSLFLFSAFFPFFLFLSFFLVIVLFLFFIFLFCHRILLLF